MKYTQEYIGPDNSRFEALNEMFGLVFVTNIKYDTDDDTDLPSVLCIDVPNDIEDLDMYISDYISNKTGFCHTGFDVVGE